MQSPWGSTGPGRLEGQQEACVVGAKWGAGRRVGRACGPEEGLGYRLRVVGCWELLCQGSVRAY